jgi:hypothetical protein
LWRLCHKVGGVVALPDDADVALGLERSGTRSRAAGYQYFFGLAESAKTPETSDLELNGLQKGGPKGRLPGQKE